MHKLIAFLRADGPEDDMTEGVAVSDREEQRKLDEAYRRIDKLRETVQALERRREPRVRA